MQNPKQIVDVDAPRASVISLAEVSTLFALAAAASVLTSVAFDAGYFAALGMAFRGMVGVADVTFGAAQLFPFIGIAAWATFEAFKRINLFIYSRWPDPASRVRRLWITGNVLLAGTLAIGFWANWAVATILYIPLHLISGIVAGGMAYAQIQQNLENGWNFKYWIFNAAMAAYAILLAVYQIGGLLAINSLAFAKDTYTVQANPQHIMTLRFFARGKVGIFCGWEMR